MAKLSHTRFQRKRYPNESCKKLDHWDALVNLTDKYPNTAMLWDKIDPLYAFPSSVFDSKILNKLFPEDQLAAEMVLTTLCERINCIGFHQTTPIVSQELVPTSLSTLLRDGAMFEFEWWEQFVAAMNQLETELSGIHTRTLGFLGYLYSDPEFLSELSSVRSLYDQLDVPVAFPLHRPIVIQNRRQVHGFRLQLVTKQDRVDRFNLQLLRLMSKWELLEFKTWDIPVPQGPLFDNPLPPGSIASSQLAAQMAVPAHFQLKDSDHVIKQISDAQSQSNPHMTPIRKALSSHADLYAQLARMMHLERTFRSRFPDGMPRGYSEVLLDMACQYLGFGKPDSAKRIRNWINKCQAGKRHCIPELCKA